MWIIFPATTVAYFNHCVEAGPSYILCSPLAVGGGLCWWGVRGLGMVACVSCLGQLFVVVVVVVVVAVSVGVSVFLLSLLLLMSHELITTIYR